MSATTTPSLSLSIFRPRFQSQASTHQFSSSSWSVSRRKILSFHRQQPQKALPLLLLHKEKTQQWSLSATPEDITQEIVSSSDPSPSEAIVSSSGGQDGVALIIQVLLFIAFAALTVLTIGVVYIGVTEFLGKREREKFEKEEAAKKSKKSGKKKNVRARAGPRGFGQKVEDDDDINIDL